MIEEARAQGLDVCCDQYPYSASATVLSADIPNWGFEGGMEGLVRRLHDPKARARLKTDMDDSHVGRWKDLYVSYVESEKNQWVIGKPVTEIAKQLGKSPADVVFDLVEEEWNRVNEIDFGMSEDDIEWIMAKSYIMPASDGEAYDMTFPGQPHPRNFGTFPRVLAHYCRDRNLFPLETAIQKMTSFPQHAWALRIGDFFAPACGQT